MGLSSPFSSNFAILGNELRRIEAEKIYTEKRIIT